MCVCFFLLLSNGRALLFVVVSHYGSLTSSCICISLVSLFFFAAYQTRLLWQTVRVNDLFFKSFTHPPRAICSTFYNVRVCINIEDGDYMCVCICTYVLFMCLCLLCATVCAHIYILFFRSLFSFIWKFPNFVALLHQPDRTTDSSISPALCAEMCTTKYRNSHTQCMHMHITLVYNAHFEHKLILVQVISTPILLLCLQNFIVSPEALGSRKLYTKISLTFYRIASHRIIWTFLWKMTMVDIANS